MIRTVTLFAALALLVSTASAAQKPNVLLVLADDLGYSDIGCYGSEIATPNLDRLAANGLRFTQCYNTARCWPTRSALITGYYPQQIHMDPPRGALPHGHAPCRSGSNRSGTAAITPASGT